MMRNTCICILTAMAFFAINAPALAQTAYPAKPIRMVAPFSPGGTFDTLARILRQKFTETWGQQVVVDSRPGASGRPLDENSDVSRRTRRTAGFQVGRNEFGTATGMRYYDCRSKCQ